MPPTVEDRLSDIRASISQIERITSNLTLEQFALDMVASICSMNGKARSPHERSDMREGSLGYRCAHAGYDRLAISPNRSALASGRHFHPEIDEAAERFGA